MDSHNQQQILPADPADAHAYSPSTEQAVHIAVEPNEHLEQLMLMQQQALEGTPDRHTKPSHDLDSG